MSENALRQYLAENPRMIGALFTLMFLLSQASNALAGQGTTYSGPGAL
jgi:F0F1-type ATP synthase membrane subunit c/vacuolar-type H+-ATPase subunit K